MNRARGSITIFSLIALMLITAAIFALLEGTRLQELRRFALLQSQSSLEAAFSNYNVCLWENYHLLGADEEEMEEILREAANGRVGTGTSILSFQLKDYQIGRCTRITDGHGVEFIQSVSSYMKDNILYESVKEIYNQYEVIQNLLNTNQVDLTKIDDALQEIEAASQSVEFNSVGTAGKTGEKPQIDIRVLLNEAKKWKENGVLELVIQDTSKVSEAQIDFSNGIFARQLKVGSNQVVEEVSWMDRILLQQYLLTYMSHYREVHAGRALSYEVEYLLGGKSSDRENLRLVVSKLLAIREAANFLYLISDPIKNQQAEILATTIGGTTLNPAIIKVIKIGLLTAWAFAESILDVRTLLEGKKIALLKSEESWTMELENIGNITQEFSTAKESKWGLNYENYLGILLLFEEETSLAMHTMNVQEATLRKQEGESFGMDSLITNVGVEICYSYKPVFPFLKVIDAEKRWKYELPTNLEYGYY